MRAFVLTLFMCGVAAAVEPRFEPQTIDDKIAIGYGLAIGDVDGDAKPDILLADKRQIVWYTNPGKLGEPWAKHVMAENLTEHDNVCIAARDIDGDGKVEVAVGAQWNPGETSDEKKSGAIFYLIRPADPTQKWEPVRIEPHDPTVHRMAWVKIGEKKFALAVLPLHGKGNKNSEGTPVRMQLITPPANLSDAKAEWKSEFVDTGMHATHNFDAIGNHAEPKIVKEVAVIGGKEGISVGIATEAKGWQVMSFWELNDWGGVGEVRRGWNSSRVIHAVISPMHGNRVAVVTYSAVGVDPHHVVIDQSLNEGHALACVDLLNGDSAQIVAGWRAPNAEKKVGIKMYVPEDEKGEKWKTYMIDDNKMACEDLKVADLDGDGKPDIIASGRATHNVVVYWNRSEIKK